MKLFMGHAIARIFIMFQHGWAIWNVPSFTNSLEWTDNDQHCLPVILTCGLQKLLGKGHIILLPFAFLLSRFSFLHLSAKHMYIYEPGMAGNFICFSFFPLWLSLTSLLLFFSMDFALACPFAAWGKSMPVCMHKVNPRTPKTHAFAEGSNKGCYSQGRRKDKVEGGQIQS